MLRQWKILAEALAACGVALGIDRLLTWLARRIAPEQGIAPAKVFSRNAEGAVVVATLTEDDITLYARRVDFAEWEPMYAERDGQIVELPTCFTLNMETIHALEQCVTKEKRI